MLPDPMYPAWQPPGLPQPVLIPWDIKGGLWMGVQDWNCALPVSGKLLCIKGGFLSDGASIPQFLESLAGDRFDPAYTAAAYGHDGMYEAEIFGHDQREQCDAEFRALMVKNGFDPERANMFYCAVRSGGGLSWNDHTPESIARARQYVTLLDVGSSLTP